MIDRYIKTVFEAVIKDIPEAGDVNLSFELPRQKEHGDLSTNIAMLLAKNLKKNPREIAEELISKLNYDNELINSVKIAGPGFINIKFTDKFFQKALAELETKGENLGKSDEGNGLKVNVEYVSCNPTGLLHLGHGRNAALGDTIANFFEMNVLADSIYARYMQIISDPDYPFPENGYHGNYVRDIAQELIEKDNNKYSNGEEADKTAIRKFGEEWCFKEIKKTLQRMKIDQDVYFNESDLYDSGKVDKVISDFKDKGLAYEKDGALWFKSSLFGDDKDRVLVKKGGEKTYFASDIAYMKDKFERNFDLLIYLWGADHYGYIERMKSACSALGYNKDQIRIIIMQLVRLIKEGKAMRMSKRKGDYVTLKELVDEVGLDVARFFFLQRASNTHLNFDLSLAKEKTEKNPVFYIQYAYARACSILKKSGIKEKDLKVNSLKELSDSSELNLSKKILRFPEIIEDTAFDYQVQRIPGYAMELTSSFHHFYHECRVISDSERTSRARHLLVIAFKKTLKNTFDLMGISSPEEM